jgi:Ni/Co efflux regulator RcnB
MKIKSMVSAILAMSLTLGGPAFAQGDGDRDAQRQVQRQVQRANQQEAQRGYQQRGERGYQQQAPRGYEQQAGGGDRHQGERGAGPDHRFYRGDRLPPEYSHRSYVVDDWRGHHLSAPPRGYRWVQMGGDYVLVAIATGVILQLLLNH